MIKLTLILKNKINILNNFFKCIYNKFKTLVMGINKNSTEEKNTINKFNDIIDIWNSYILKYKYCQKKLKLEENGVEIKTNYFGDILEYFNDTYDIIFNNNNLNNLSEHMSFLQSIYVQQDFIEELLRLFNIGINKGCLKSDPNYTINRDIRNEFIGHPFRQLNGEFISSCIYHHRYSNSDKIVYIIYHKDNNYKPEKRECLIKDIIDRHYKFLNTYFDKIINKLKNVLKKHKKEIINLKKLVESNNHSFEIKLKSIELHFESILESAYLYTKEELIEIYNKKDEHKRYSFFIEDFYNVLKKMLKETKTDIDKYLINNK